MAWLTPDQIARLTELLRDAAVALAYRTLGYELTPETMQRLAARGLLTADATATDLIAHAYQYGRVLGMRPSDHRPRAWTREKLAEHLKAHPVPLTPVEQAAVAEARQRAGEYCVGLGDRYGAEVVGLAAHVDATLEAEHRAGIQREVAAAVAQRKTAGQLRTALRHIADDYGRDWERIANTEMQLAQQRGFADRLEARHGPEVLVAKLPEPRACEHCRALYLGDDGRPRVMPLSWWRANGDANVGRKPAEWRAVLGAMHPHCFCQLVHVPAGMGFDAKWAMRPLAMLKAERLRGGLGDGRADGDFDPKALAEGMAVEREHTDDPKVAREIAKDHLTEDPDYYRKLRRIEKAAKRRDPITRRSFAGLDVSIEHDIGSARHWHNSHDGTSGTTVFRFPYGYIRGTTGTDGDHVDVFLGPLEWAPTVYVIDQTKAPDFRAFDEQKVMVGFTSAAAAKQAYLAHFNSPRFYGGMRAIPLAVFRARWKMGVYDRGGRKIQKADQLSLNFDAGTGGPWIGPRGGKWADQQHTIHWRDRAPARPNLDDGYDGGLIDPAMTIEEAEDAIRGAPVEHAGVWIDGKLTWRGKGGRSYVEVPPEVAKSLKESGNADFTHNHPSGRMLSGEDFLLTFALNVRTTRATRPDGSAWVLRRPEGREEWGQQFARVPGATTLQEAIRIVWDGAVNVAKHRMDAWITRNGGDAGDTSHPSFSEERWSGYVDEETFRAFNAFIRPTGATIEHVSARPAARAVDSRQGSAPVRRRRKRGDEAQTAAMSAAEAGTRGKMAKAEGQSYSALVGAQPVRRMGDVGTMALHPDGLATGSRAPARPETRHPGHESQRKRTKRAVRPPHTIRRRAMLDAFEAAQRVATGRVQPMPEREPMAMGAPERQRADLERRAAERMLTVRRTRDTGRGDGRR